MHSERAAIQKPHLLLDGGCAGAVFRPSYFPRRAQDVIGEQPMAGTSVSVARRKTRSGIGSPLFYRPDSAQEYHLNFPMTQPSKDAITSPDDKVESADQQFQSGRALSEPYKPCNRHRYRSQGCSGTYKLIRNQICFLEYVYSLLKPAR